ncbi:MAG: hypothetical protein ACRDID_11025 [Ktedonobacterales bacterium]
MTALLRWRGWLILIATLLLFSACSTGRPSHPITGATATTGSVTVTTNLSTYTAGDAIGATVTNNSKSDFYTQNGKSGCTIIQLEKFDTASGKWTHLDGCNGASPTQILAIAESSSVPYTLAPTSSADLNAWQPGTYRVSVAYSTQADGATSPQEAHSAAFTVSG